MAAHRVGSLEPFEPTGNPGKAWESYVARLEQYFIFNDITDTVKMRAALLMFIGSVGYTQLTSLVAPDKPPEMEYVTLVNVMSRHYRTNESDVVKQFRFFTRHRKEGESISSYIAELRVLAEEAGFSGMVPLDTLLRNVFVCGINDSRMRDKMFQLSGHVILAQVLRIAVGMEASANSVREISADAKLTPKKEQEAGDVNQVTRSKPQELCGRCGNRGHESERCRFKQLECFRCGKKGHTSKVCRKAKGRNRSAESTKALEAERLSASDDDDFNMLETVQACSSGRDNPMQLEFALKGVKR